MHSATKVAYVACSEPVPFFTQSCCHGHCMCVGTSIPPISSSKHFASDRSISTHNDAMEHGDSVRLTGSASSAKTLVAKDKVRVCASSAVRKGCAKEVNVIARQDLVCQHDGSVGQVSEVKDVANTLPTDAKLSAEVLVSSTFE